MISVYLLPNLSPLNTFLLFIGSVSSVRNDSANFRPSPPLYPQSLFKVGMTQYSSRFRLLANVDKLADKCRQTCWQMPTNLLTNVNNRGEEEPARGLQVFVIIKP